MIRTLKSGDALSKELMNGLIVKANGLNTPSDSFVNTSNGPLLVDNKVQYVNKFRPTAECLFQTKYVPAFEVTNRDPISYDTTKMKMTWQCYLGPDYDSLSSAIHTNVKIEGIWNFTGENTTTIKFEDSTLSTASGFFDLAIYDADGIAVNLIKAKIDDNDTDPKYGLVVADEKTTDFTQMSDQSEFSGKSSITVEKKVTIGKLNVKKQLFQMHLGDIDFTTSDGETDLDTSLSMLHQMSLERTTKTIDGKEVKYEQIYGFELSNNTMDASSFIPDEGGNSDGKADILIRWTKEDVDKTKQIAYVSLSSITGDVISGDTQATEEFGYTPKLHSIELVEGLGCGTTEKYYKLHNFEQGSCSEVQYYIDYFDYPTYYSGCETYVSKTGDADGCGHSSMLIKKVVDSYYPQFNELQYAMPTIKLPRFTLGDTETVYGQNSIQVSALNGCASDPHYYELYGWQTDETQTVSVNLQWGQSVELNNQPFLVRDFGTLTYKKVQLTMPTEPLTPPDFSGDINNITNDITVIQNQIVELSGQLSNITEQLSNVWIKQGTYAENYGYSIGNGCANEVINLDEKRLCGWGWSSNNFCVGTLYTGDYGSYLDGNKLYLESYGEVQLGSQTLTESDIAKLHQLISDHGL